MEEFFKKYIKSFEAKDAIKILDKHVDKAIHLCDEHNIDYLRELATAYDMISDYFAIKGVDLRTYERA